MSLAELFGISADKYHDKKAIVCDDQIFTYGQLQNRCNQLSNALIAEGIKEQEKVAIISPNIPQYLECIIACSQTNIILLSINWRLSASEVAEQIKEYQPGILFFSNNYMHVLSALLESKYIVPKFICIDEQMENTINYNSWISQQSIHFENREPSVNDVMFQLFTSGTTGGSKGVLLTHGGLCSYTSMYIASTNWTSDVIYQYLSPLFHISCLSAYICLMVGGTLVMLSNTNIDYYLRVAEREKVNRISVVPIYLQWLLSYEHFDDYDLSSIDVVVYSSAPMPVPVIHTAMQKLSCKFIQCYGMTEMGIITALMPEDHVLTGSGRAGSKLNSVGKPLNGVEILVIDKNGQQCPHNVAGEIIVKSASMMKGYCNMPEETAIAIRDGWYFTGDIGYFDEDDYLFLVDRKNDMIISGGENISPREIERCIGSLYEHVKNVAVVGVPDSKWGEAVAAFVVKWPDSNISFAEIIEYCKEHLASYKKPQYIEFVEELPMNGNGKVLKNALKTRILVNHKR